MVTSTWTPRYIKPLACYAVSDENGNDALDTSGRFTRYKTETAAQRRADKLNTGQGLENAGQAIVIRRGVPVGGLGR